MLYDHTITMLTRSLGQTFVDNTKIEFILTCPAVWSDRSKNATLQAAEGTGMAKSCKIRLISEPEAAALYTLKTIQPKNLQVDFLGLGFSIWQALMNNFRPVMTRVLLFAMQVVVLWI